MESPLAEAIYEGVLYGMVHVELPCRGSPQNRSSAGAHTSTHRVLRPAHRSLPLSPAQVHHRRPGGMSANPAASARKLPSSPSGGSGPTLNNEAPFGPCVIAIKFSGVNNEARISSCVTAIKFLEVFWHTK